MKIWTWKSWLKLWLPTILMVLVTLVVVIMSGCATPIKVISDNRNLYAVKKGDIIKQPGYWISEDILKILLTKKDEKK
jgi:uncharacterized protein YceK